MAIKLATMAMKKVAMTKIQTLEKIKNAPQKQRRYKTTKLKVAPIKLINTVHTFIKQHNLIPHNTTVVLGLSGGPDSVFLLHVLAQLVKQGTIKKLIAAHLDHEWRPNSSEDAQFCRTLAKKYEVHLVVVKKMSDLTISLKFNGSLEELGRRARRFFFKEVCTEFGATAIALAHHAQDQQETFFIRLIRGATLTGLTAMKPRYGNYIRPLLDTNKSDILHFLATHNIPYLVDPSNDTDDFLRNRIRKTVLPALRDCDSRFDTKFKQTLEKLQETEYFLQIETEKAFAQISTKTEQHYDINIDELLALHPVLLQRVLLYWLCQENVSFPVSHGFFAEILRFLQQKGEKSHTLHQNWCLTKKRGNAHIESIEHI